MWWRLAFPLVMILGPRLIPRVVRGVYLVWKLVLDSRVPILLKLILPAPLLYLATPIARILPLAAAGLIVLVPLAMWVFVSLAPRHVVEHHAPWRARGEPRQRPEDRSKVVEGTYHVVDEEERGK